VQARALRLAPQVLQKFPAAEAPQLGQFMERSVNREGVEGLGSSR
jgi:hypothetical protein